MHGHSTAPTTKKSKPKSWKTNQPEPIARFYSNENFPLPVVEELRRLGHDVLTTFESDNAGRAIPDEQVLEFAVEHQRAALTYNRKHFIRLHQAHPNHFGIVVCTVDSDFARLAQ